MPSNSLIFLKHAKPNFSKDIVISKWNVPQESLLQVKKLLAREEFQNLDIIISSKEEKAILTAQVFSEHFSKEILSYPELNELNRDKGKWLTNDEYKQNVRKTFENRHKSIGKWEKGIDALKRFSNRITLIDNTYSNQKILIVSHGIVINLFFANILNNFEEIFERWESNDFCDYGIIKDKQILVDIDKRIIKQQIWR